MNIGARVKVTTGDRFNGQTGTLYLIDNWVWLVAIDGIPYGESAATGFTEEEVSELD